MKKDKFKTSKGTSPLFKKKTLDTLKKVRLESNFNPKKPSTDIKEFSIDRLYSILLKAPISNTEVGIPIRAYTKNKKRFFFIDVMFSVLPPGWKNLSPSNIPRQVNIKDFLFSNKVKSIVLNDDDKTEIDWKDVVINYKEVKDILHFVSFEEKPIKTCLGYKFFSKSSIIYHLTKLDYEITLQPISPLKMMSPRIRALKLIFDEVFQRKYNIDFYWDEKTIRKEIENDKDKLNKKFFYGVYHSRETVKSRRINDDNKKQNTRKNILAEYFFYSPFEEIIIERLYKNHNSKYIKGELKT